MLDPLLLSLHVYKETGQHVQFLAAEKSLKRKFVGFFSRLMESSTCLRFLQIFDGSHILVPVARSADNAKIGTGTICLSETDSCLVLGIDTRFTTEFTPRMQILLGKVYNYSIAEVVEVISDTQLRIRQEFNGGNGPTTALLKEKAASFRAASQPTGVEFKTLPYINQQEMYRYVYERLRQGGSIGIFPEGPCLLSIFSWLKLIFVCRRQP